MKSYKIKFGLASATAQDLVMSHKPRKTQKHQANGSNPA
jgi:hypothetical protein